MGSGICSFWQPNGIRRNINDLPKILETTSRMTMKSLPDANLNKETPNQENETFWNASITKFCRIINIDVKINPEKLRLIFWILAVLQNFLWKDTKNSS